MEIDTFTPEKLLDCARKIVAGANCCRADTLKAAAELIEKDADDDYYEEGEMLKAIAEFLASKCQQKELGFGFLEASNKPNFMLNNTKQKL